MEQGKLIPAMMIDLIKKRHKVGQGTSKNRHPEACVCVYHIDEWRSIPYMDTNVFKFLYILIKFIICNNIVIQNEKYMAQTFTFLKMIL